MVLNDISGSMELIPPGDVWLTGVEALVDGSRWVEVEAEELTGTDPLSCVVSISLSAALARVVAPLITERINPL